MDKSSKTIVVGPMKWGDLLEMVYELLQRTATLPQSDPFSVLDTCTFLMIRYDDPHFTDSTRDKSILEAIFLKVMDMIYGHEGSDSQTIINMVYRVRPTLPLEV